jgi:F0F1-type ATP synthase assembly protein I
MSKSKNRSQDEFRAAVTMTVFWVAGLTLVIIFAALFTGLWLDKILESKPLFTIVFVLASIPVTLLLTFRVVRASTKMIQPAGIKDITEEEPHRGEDN